MTNLPPAPSSTMTPAAPSGNAARASTSRATSADEPQDVAARAAAWVAERDRLAESLTEKRAGLVREIAEIDALLAKVDPRGRGPTELSPRARLVRGRLVRDGSRGETMLRFVRRHPGVTSRGLVAACGGTPETVSVLRAKGRLVGVRGEADNILHNYIPGTEPGAVAELPCAEMV